MNAALTETLLLSLGLIFLGSVFFIIGKLRGTTPKQRLVPDRSTALKMITLFAAIIAWGELARALTRNYFPECEALPRNEKYWLGLLVTAPIYLLGGVAIGIYKRSIEEGRVREYMESTSALPRFRHWRKKRS